MANIMVVIALCDIYHRSEDNLHVKIEGEQYWRGWSTKIAKQGHIWPFLSNETIENVSDDQSAKPMGDVIKNFFERHALPNKFAARETFYTVTLETEKEARWYQPCKTACIYTTVNGGNCWWKDNCNCCTQGTSSLVPGSYCGFQYIQKWKQVVHT